MLCELVLINVERQVVCTDVAANYRSTRFENGKVEVAVGNSKMKENKSTDHISCGPRRCYIYLHLKRGVRHVYGLRFTLMV